MKQLQYLSRTEKARKKKWGEEGRAGRGTSDIQFLHHPSVLHKCQRNHITRFTLITPTLWLH